MEERPTRRQMQKRSRMWDHFSEVLVGCLLKFGRCKHCNRDIKAVPEINELIEEFGSTNSSKSKASSSKSVCKPSGAEPILPTSILYLNIDWLTWLELGMVKMLMFMMANWESYCWLLFNFKCKSIVIYHYQFVLLNT